MTRFLSIDGIAGVGKGLALKELAETLNVVGVRYRIVHFYTELMQLGYHGHIDTIALRRTLHFGRASPQVRVSAFNTLCCLACDAFWTMYSAWEADVIAFDRSPISYLGYSEGAFRIPVPCPTRYDETVLALKPIILVGNPEAAVARVKQRDHQSKGVLHEISATAGAAVQTVYVREAMRLGLVCREQQQIRDALVARAVQ